MTVIKAIPMSHGGYLCNRFTVIAMKWLLYGSNKTEMYFCRFSRIVQSDQKCILFEPNYYQDTPFHFFVPSGTRAG